MIIGLLTVIVTIIAVSDHSLLWLLAIFPGLYILYAFFITFSKAPKLKDSILLTKAEQEAWSAHHAFIRFTSAAPNMAGSLSALQLISILAGVAFIATGLYWGGLLVMFWFILGTMTPRLNPRTSFVPAAQKGDRAAIKRVEALGSLMQKLNKAS